MHPRLPVSARACGIVFALGGAAVAAWLLARPPERPPAAPSKPLTRPQPAAPGPVAPPIQIRSVAGGAVGDCEPPAVVAARAALAAGRTGDGDFGPRHLAASELPEHLDPAAHSELLAWLAAPEQGAMSPQEYASLRSALASALASQIEPVPGFVDLLLADWANPASGEIWRDYTIQFLGILSKREDYADDRARMIECLWAATCDPDASIAGTALISLRNIPAALGPAPEEIAGRAIELCRDPAFTDAVKATALQIATELRHPETLAIAREEARRAPAPLRLAAFAALGALGDETDAAWLATLSDSRDARVRFASTTALNRMQSRKETP